MINTQKLKARLIEQGTTIDDISAKIGISKYAFYRRLKRKSFSIPEIDKLKKELKLTNKEMLSIFFDDGDA